MIKKEIFFFVMIVVFSANLFSEIIWEKLFDKNEVDFITRVKKTSDGKLILGLKSHIDLGNEEYDKTAWIIKTTSIGDIIWEKEFNLFSWSYTQPYEDELQDITIFDDDTILLLFTVRNGDVGSAEAIIIKLDIDGNELWRNNYTAEEISVDRDRLELYSIIDKPNNGFAVTGHINLWNKAGRTTNNEFFTAMFNSEGTYEWYDFLDDPGYRKEGTRITKAYDLDGNNTGVVAVGKARLDLYSKWNTRIVNYDFNGDIVWDKVYETEQDNHVYSIKTLSDYSYIITGSMTFLNDKSKETFFYQRLLKIDNNGEIVWDRSYNGEYNRKRFDDVCEIADGFYVTANDYGNYFGVDLVKMDSEGIFESSNFISNTWVYNLFNLENNLSILAVGRKTIGANQDGLLFEFGEINNIYDENQINTYELYQNYPNPFNPETKIRYQFVLSSNQFAKIVVFNSAGQKVWSSPITDHTLHVKGSILFDGSKFNSGIYYYSLFIDGKKMDTKSMVLIK